MFKHKAIQNLIKYYASFIDKELLRFYLHLSNGVLLTPLDHLKAAAQWICQAQDASGDEGVARSYSLIYNLYFKVKGWAPSYPETTGYIIPTMFDYAHLVESDEIYDRVVRMADWECKVQMESGAVQGGTIDQIPTPAIFNTGQVIFGWVRAFEETQKDMYLDSAIKAGRFLIQNQDSDGAWRRNLSNYASSKMPFYTYNTRTAWALLVLASVTNDSSYREACVRNIDFALGQQLENGWFDNNCLGNPEQPLLHTIAYCIDGILGVGLQLNNQEYIKRTRKTADALLQRQRQDGSLAGCFDRDWQPTVSWSCLTGDAQTAIIWGKLFQITGEHKYLDAMQRINEYLMKLQFLKTKNPNLYGGIAGSNPIYGQYGRFEILNWAVKFFMDALMLQMSIFHKKT